MEEEEIKYNKGQHDPYLAEIMGKLGPQAITLSLLRRASDRKSGKRDPIPSDTSDPGKYDPFLAENRRDEMEHKPPQLIMMPFANGNDPLKRKKGGDQYHPYEDQYLTYKKARELAIYGVKKAKEKAKSLYSASNTVAAALKRRFGEYLKKDYEIDFEEDDKNSNKKETLYEKVASILTKGYDGFTKAVEYLKTVGYDGKTEEGGRDDSYRDSVLKYGIVSLGDYVTGAGYSQGTEAVNDDYSLLEMTLQPEKEVEVGGLEAITTRKVVSMEEFRRKKRVVIEIDDLDRAA